MLFLATRRLVSVNSRFLKQIRQFSKSTSGQTTSNMAARRVIVNTAAAPKAIGPYNQVSSRQKLFENLFPVPILKSGKIII